MSVNREPPASIETAHQNKKNPIISDEVKPLEAGILFGIRATLGKMAWSTM